jgi:hypothetical protein|tara:strand:+ start:14005 stop:14604 length:600 start_codon:yes stop_codon:yes gene_type:complete
MPAALTTAALIALGGGLAKGVGAAAGQYAQGKALMGEEQEKRLKELQRMEEMNALGLTDNERSQFSQLILDPVQAQAKESMQRQQALIGPAGGAGQAFNQAMAMDDKQRKIQQEAGAKLAEADLRTAQAQEDELMKLSAQSDAADAMKSTAIYQFIGQGVGGAADAYLQQQAFANMATPRNQSSGLYLTPEDLQLLETF